MWFRISTRFIISASYVIQFALRSLENHVNLLHSENHCGFSQINIFFLKLMWFEVFGTICSSFLMDTYWLISMLWLFLIMAISRIIIKQLDFFTMLSHFLHCWKGFTKHLPPSVVFICRIHSILSMYTFAVLWVGSWFGWCFHVNLLQFEGRFVSLL